VLVLPAFCVGTLPVESERGRVQGLAQMRWFQHLPAARDVHYPTGTPHFYHPAASPVKHKHNFIRFK